MRKIIGMILNLLFSHRQIVKNKIVFETGNHKPGDNPYAIYRYIKKHCPDQYQTIWFVKKGNDIADVDPKDVVYYRTWSYFYHLSTAHFWIRSHSVGSLLKKRNEQIYIQTWHGGGAFKKCGYDIDEAIDRPPVAHVREWDYFIASDPYNASMIQTAYGYNQKIEIIGLPRSDDIVNKTDEDFTKLRKQILPHVKAERKVILYAPTFREKDIERQTVSLPIQDLSTFDQYLFLIRLHPYVRNNLDQATLSANMLDVSNYANVQDLLMVSDCLITDYSSIIFDYALLKRPMIFYTYDYKEYMEERTGFYLDYDKDLPGIRANTQSELVEQLQNFEQLEAACGKPLQAFNEKYNVMNDGFVCKRVLHLIEELNKGGNYDEKNS